MTLWFSSLAMLRQVKLFLSLGLMAFMGLPSCRRSEVHPRRKSTSTCSALGDAMLRIVRSNRGPCSTWCAAGASWPHTWWRWALLKVGKPRDSRVGTKALWPHCLVTSIIVLWLHLWLLSAQWWHCPGLTLTSLYLSDLAGHLIQPVLFFMVCYQPESGTFFVCEHNNVFCSCQAPFSNS